MKNVRCLCSSREGVTCKGAVCDLAHPTGAPGNADQCVICWQAGRRPPSWRAGEPPPQRQAPPTRPPTPPPHRPPCAHKGDPTGELVGCSTCAGNVQLKLFGCALHGRCTVVKSVPGFACCETCPDHSAAPAPPAKALRWAYGVTTVPARRRDLLPRTLASLKAAGFGAARLFVDGTRDFLGWSDDFGQEVTARWPAVGVAANWALALCELWWREPLADRYAIFQDDLLACRGLRNYLDRCPYPERGYLNLYAMSSNEAVVAGRRGFVEASLLDAGPWQSGRGAVALVFSREAVKALSAAPSWLDKPRDAARPGVNVDGAVVTALNAAGWREHVHAPSLVQHVGQVSARGGRPHPQAKTFPGESFDATALLENAGAAGACASRP